MKRFIQYTITIILLLILISGCWLWINGGSSSIISSEELIEPIVEQQPVELTQVKIDRKFMRATVGELKVNESGWIPKEAVVIDSERNVWVDGSHPIQWSISELQPDKDEVKLLKVWRLPQGIAIGLPQIHYECNKEHFLWDVGQPDPEQHLAVVKAQLPIPGLPEQFMPKTIAELKEGQGGWIEIAAISIDLDRRIYVDVSKELQEIDNMVDEHKYHFLWCKRGQAGYEIYIPRVSYQKCGWLFQWEPSQHNFREPNYKRPVVIFTVAPEVQRAEKIDAPEKQQ